MNLYHWRYSEALRQYSCGSIVVMAESEEQARDKVRAAFTGWLATEWESLFMQPQDEDDRAEIARHIATMENDLIERPPEIRDVIFIKGSE